MAVGNHSLRFIAFMARRGWDDDEIRLMYNHALHEVYLSSPSIHTWMKAEAWLGNTQGSAGQEVSADRG